MTAKLMTTIFAPFTGMVKSGRDLHPAAHPAVRRIHAGSLLELSSVDQRNPQQKWVVFEDISEGASCRYQLTLYTNSSEKRKKKSHLLDSDTFIGVEEGIVGQGAQEERYFVIFLTSSSLIFQCKDQYEASTWCKHFKEHLTHERWTISLKDVDANKLEHYLLHVTSSSVSLTHINPPKLYKRWNIANIIVNCENGFLHIGVSGAGRDSGFFQIKTQNSTQMSQIKNAISNVKKDIHVDGEYTTQGMQMGTPQTNSPSPAVPIKPALPPHSPFTAPVKFPWSTVQPDVVAGKTQDDVTNPQTSSIEFVSHSPTAPVIKRSRFHVPDVVIGTVNRPSGTEEGISGAGEDGRSGAEEIETEDGDRYINDIHHPNYQNPLLPPMHSPPPLPPRDENRHFQSDTIGDTIHAIREKKVCFRDSLHIRPEVQHQLFATMDATGWWKELAAEIGLNVSDIEIVKSHAPKLNKSETEMVIYHWECTRNPMRICSIREIQNIAQETNRQDLLSMLADA